MATVPGTETAAEHLWRSRRLAHEERVDAWTTPYLERRSRGCSHPVEDFLFTYYGYSPASLRRWQPGLGVRIGGSEAHALTSVNGYAYDGSVAQLDPRLPALRQKAVSQVRRLLVATAERRAALGCFGLHEWAMVYRQRPDERRHASYPLRLGAQGSDAVVDGHRVTCSHFDAYRFFTTAARPRNALRPTAGERGAFEQPGCLHATMDLHKWAFKLSPFTSSELVADCFALARDVRLLDMRASPYDLSSLGVEPIPIETAPGKAAFVAAQREFAQRAAPLRNELIAVCNLTLQAAVDTVSGLSQAR
jgi:hypothetical protein